MPNKPSRNLQYANMAKRMNLARAFDPPDRSGAPVAMPNSNGQEKQSDRPFEIRSSALSSIHQTYKRATPGLIDTCFDVSIRRTGDRYSALAVGEHFIYGRYPVPLGQKFTMQSYLFWVEVDERPAITYPVLAEPNELWGFGDFHMYVNGQVPMFNPYWINAVEYEGYPIVAHDINSDSNPNSPGVVVIAKGGTEITISFRRINAGAMYRQMMAMGVRLRGFFSPEFTSDQDER